METTTNSQKQTEKIAQNLAANLKGGDTVALYGDLGSGKTVFVKGLAKGLGIKRRITSPTFVFVKSYKISKGFFHHVDLYRGEQQEDLATLGLSEIFSKDAIVALEWADRIKKGLPKNRIDVFIEVVNEKTRRITIKDHRTFHSCHSGESSQTRRHQNLKNKDDSGQARLAESKRARMTGSMRILEEASQILRAGGVVIFPTDTVYGIGCRYDNQKAIERLYQIKKTPKDQEFPILVSNIGQVRKLAKVSVVAEKLIRKYWPGGLTIILRHKPGLRSGQKPDHKPGLSPVKIGFRMPDSKLVLDLVDQVGIPIIGTSANFHGQKAPKSFDKLDPELVKLVDFVIRGKCKEGIESTVVDATSDPPKILRHGAVIINQLTQLT